MFIWNFWKYIFRNLNSPSPLANRHKPYTLVVTVCRALSSTWKRRNCVPRTPSGMTLSRAKWTCSRLTCIRARSESAVSRRAAAEDPRLWAAERTPPPLPQALTPGGRPRPATAMRMRVSNAPFPPPRCAKAFLLLSLSPSRWHALSAFAALLSFNACVPRVLLDSLLAWIWRSVNASCLMCDLLITFCK